MICTAYGDGTSRTVNFWNLVPSKKIISRRGIFPITKIVHLLSSGFICGEPCGTYRRGFKMAVQLAKMPTIQPPNLEFFHFEW